MERNYIVSSFQRLAADDDDDDYGPRSGQGAWSLASDLKDGTWWLKDFKGL